MGIKVKGPGTITLRKSLGRRLIALRARSGKTYEEITLAGLGSRQKVNRMENGEGVQRPGDVRALCWLYGASEEETNALYEMALRAMEGSMWEDFSDVLPSWFGLYVELEAIAETISTFQPGLVPGLLQTQEYARAVYRKGVPLLAPEKIERQVVMRMERQRVRFADDRSAGRITAVLDEGVLTRRVGGPEVAEAQLEHLRKLNATEQVSIRVLTWESGAHGAMEGAFTLLELPEPEPTVTYVETRIGARYHEKLPVVEGYHRVFRSVYEQAVPLEEYAP